MRKFLGTLVLIALVIGVVGASRDWFSLDKTEAGRDTQLQLRIDREKIRTDTREAAEIAQEVRENIRQKIDDAGDK